MHALNVLAAEGIKNRDLWYPTILGVLVVVAAVALFMGTVYILLATNLGSRLGFLVTAAGLSGFMVLLSLLWLTNPSPVNTLKGRIPAWKAVEAIDNGDIARSKIPAVREINEKGHDLDQADVTNVKAALDTNLIINKNEQTGEILSGARASTRSTRTPPATSSRGTRSPAAARSSASSMCRPAAASPGST